MEQNSGKQAKNKKRRVDAPAEEEDDDDNDESLRQEMKEYILCTLNEAADEGSGQRMWSKLPGSFKNDKEIAFLAWSSGFVDHSTPPSCLGREDFRAVIEKGRLDWVDLPPQLRDDEGFAREIVHYPSSTLVQEIFERFESLVFDRGIWVKVIDSKRDDVDEILSGFAPNQILADRELMLEACHQNDYVLFHVQSSLGEDLEFLKVVLRNRPSALRMVSHDAQRLFPGLIIESLAPFCQQVNDLDFIVDLAEVTHPDLWENHSFVLGWFRAGLPFPVGSWGIGVDTSAWVDDREIFLLIAKHCRREPDLQSFRHASATIRGDKDFMMKAVEQNPVVFCHASVDLQKDFDLAVLAFASSRYFVAGYLAGSHYSGQQDFIRNLHIKIQEKLKTYDAFFKTILCGSSSHFASEPCALGLLKEQACKMIIAEYLDAPIGKELRLLRLAFENLIVPFS